MRLGGGGRGVARPNVTSFSHERAFSRSCEIIGRMRRRRDASSSRLPFLRYADYSENAVSQGFQCVFATSPLHKSTWLTFDLYAFCFIFRVKKVNGSAEKRFPRDTEVARRGRMKYNHLQHLRLNTCTAGRDGVRHELWSTRRHCRGE